MRNDWIKFDSIEKNRNGYFITYQPVFDNSLLAILTLTFYKDTSAEKAVEKAEIEFDYWIRKYPTPLMLFIRDETKLGFNYKKVVDSDYLIGYVLKSGKIKKVWGSIDENEYEDFDNNVENLKKIYSNLNFKTKQDIDLNIKKQVTENRILKVLLILRFSIIPALIVFFGWYNPLVSFIALLYNLYLFFLEGIKINGNLIKSEQEKIKDKEDLLKDHYYYHCKLNPEGFECLKLENFKRENKKIEYLI